MESYLQVNLLGPGPRLMKKRIYRAAVSQRLRNTGIGSHDLCNDMLLFFSSSKLHSLTSHSVTLSTEHYHSAHKTR
jgi:hypothetical protein